jgi:signal transduction histidine kinase
MPGLRSLESKLIFTSVVVVVAVLGIAGGVFIYMSRDDERQQALDRVSANSSAIQSEFILRLIRGDSQQALVDYASKAAVDYGVRTLMIDPQSRVVVDSKGELDGKTLTVNADQVQARFVAGRSDPYLTFQVAEGSPGSGLVLVSPPFISPWGTQQFISFQPLRYSLVLAVSDSSLATAWLDLLPGMALAAAIALPVAVLLAVLIAAYITRPLEKLTVASLQMAAGRFDVDVSVERQDEVGRLARAFSTMAEHVGTSNAQMRTLVANVSHDMKTPLTSILGFSQILRDEKPQGAEETRRIAGIIHEEAQRLNARLSDLLYLSELESGQVVLNAGKVDLTKLLRGAAARIEPEVHQRHVELSAELPESQVVVTDGPKLERAVENLLENARKYTPDGGAIEVRSGNGNGAVWIEVSNTAGDIAPEELPHLFERFYRRDRSRAVRSGSGLGLTIAKDIVTLLGGRLDASLREGSIVFRAELPTTRQPVEV